ncbi:hypothetical protein F5Y16DRAFT_396300 [Xylariaceae sp. FL0255]|nr:hypothetical protein F5Y16DRAFT_396300 [Xylariaceae sp. FL0255]
MADQCIVCLENLDVKHLTPPPQSPPESHDTQHGIPHTPPLEPAPTLVVGTTDPATPSLIQVLGDNITTSTTTKFATSQKDDDNDLIAVIQVCGHVLHDSCLREWTGKANSCPICRQNFHMVDVYDKVGGTLLSSYKVEDKKQVAEFDPQTWLDENPEDEEEIRPCPICGHADHEDVLLLCDSCDAPYHTYCVGLDSVPHGHWFCMECADEAAQLLLGELEDAETSQNGLSGFSDGQSDYLPRTQATMRRARRRARSDEWQGAWGQIAGHIWDALDIDLDNHDDDPALQDWRQSQQRGERDRREYFRWQQRLNIASRLGAREVFEENISNMLPQRIVRQPHAPPPPPPPETPEIRQAWGALEKAMEAETPNRQSPNQRKRKTRSVTASPVEPPPPQERKLKRPRTRRVPTQSEASSSNATAALQNGQAAQASSSTNGRSGSPLPSLIEGPSFLSSLLKEVEMSAPSDDENIRLLLASSKPSTDPMSPAASPSPSAHSSPRALSITPPPRGINERPGSPLSLTSRIEPIYPPANYTVARNGSDSDSESRPRQSHSYSHQVNGNHFTTEIRQPRPRRHASPLEGSNHHSRSPETSPSRHTLPIELKETLSGIVKDALKPHWKSGQLTADQYANINRDLSHKLYREVSDLELNEEARSRFEKIANKEVTRAVEDLKASSSAIAVV